MTFNVGDLVVVSEDFNMIIHSSTNSFYNPYKEAYEKQYVFKVVDSSSGIIMVELLNKTKHFFDGYTLSSENWRLYKIDYSTITKNIVGR